MDRRILGKLTDIVGADAVLSSRDERLRHSCDATRRSVLPDAVVEPRSTEQVARIAKLCTEEKIPLTPRGAGTGLSGGSVPVSGGVVLSLTGMKQVREVVSEDLYAICEAGVVTEQFQRTVQAVSLYYPPDPTSYECSTIGGNIAAAARGLRCLKYGVTKNYVMGLEAVLSTGEVVRTGAKTVKSVVGFDLTRLLCGSGGTLAIVTAAILRLIPLPEHRETILGSFESLEEAASASREVIARGVVPAALEIMDCLSVSSVLKEAELPWDLEGRSLLLAEVDGFKEAAGREAVNIQKVFEESGALFVKRTSDEKERDAVWEARRGVLTGLAKLRPITILENVTVPRSRIVEMARAIADIARKHGLLIATFGHAGDGNLHPTILVDTPLDSKDAAIRAAVAEMSDAALCLGGTLSGEHGIGIGKTAFLKKDIEGPAFETMKKLKRVFDPEGILNPGKLFAQGDTGHE